MANLPVQQFTTASRTRRPLSTVQLEELPTSPTAASRHCHPFGARTFLSAAMCYDRRVETRCSVYFVHCCGQQCPRAAGSGAMRRSPTSGAQRTARPTLALV